jgi:hypothetical protein
VRIATEIEVRILAAQDAVWVPLRDWGGSRPANVYRARREFDAHGIHWRSTAMTEQQSRDRSRELDGLRKRGRITCFQPRAKTLRARLSDRAEAETRALCGLPPLAAAVGLMGELARHSRRKARTLDRLWVPEVKLNRGRGWGDDHHRELVAVEDTLLPALARGWVVSLATVQRHVYYALAPTGWAALEQNHPPPPPGEADLKAWPVYAEQLNRVLAGWAHVAPDTDRDLGAIPLPVSMHGVEIGPWGVTP